jgi:hypothetical protein
MNLARNNMIKHFLEKEKLIFGFKNLSLLTAAWEERLGGAHGCSEALRANSCTAVERAR